ncbi:PH domain-containing protein [Listeria rocourtiae]|uniref:PH domain-containing protein n=1 Tax=Listeria rocourtiae TaxID=647910 RepID=UPI003D2F5F1D
MRDNELIITFPATLSDLELYISKMPKTVRKFHDSAMKQLRKIVKKNELIHAFEESNTKTTKTGIFVVSDSKIILFINKGGLLGKVENEVYNLKDLVAVDYDIMPNPIGQVWTNSGSIELKIKKTLGQKKVVIKNIDEEKVLLLKTKLEELIN